MEGLQQMIRASGSFVLSPTTKENTTRLGGIFFSLFNLG